MCENCRCTASLHHQGFGCGLEWFHLDAQKHAEPGGSRTSRLRAILIDHSMFRPVTRLETCESSRPLVYRLACSLPTPRTYEVLGTDLFHEVFSSTHVSVIVKLLMDTTVLMPWFRFSLQAAGDRGPKKRWTDTGEIHGRAKVKSFMGLIQQPNMGGQSRQRRRTKWIASYEILPCSSCDTKGIIKLRESTTKTHNAVSCRSKGNHRCIAAVQRHSQGVATNPNLYSLIHSVRLRRKTHSTRAVPPTSKQSFRMLPGVEAWVSQTQR